LDQHIEEWKIEKLNTYRFSFWCLWVCTYLEYCFTTCK
jgi:hypothetical protein